MAFQPTHRVPAGGVPTWEVPDPARAPQSHLDAGLPVEVVQVQGGWTQIRCSNGWVAWIDGGRLEANAVAGGGSAPSSVVAVPTTNSGRVALGAGVAVIVLSALPWLSVTSGGASFSRTAWKLPAAVLVDREADPDGIKLALLLLLIGGATIGLALYEPTSTVARWAGVPMIAVTVLYVIQVSRVPGLGPTDAGLGAWLTAAVGGLCLGFPWLEAASRQATSTATTTAPTTTTPTATPEPNVAGWSPTHRVAATGAGCFEQPDAATALAVRLDPGLDVRVIDQTMGWAHVACSNGWTTWIDGRELQPLA